MERTCPKCDSTWLGVQRQDTLYAVHCFSCGWDKPLGFKTPQGFLPWQGAELDVKLEIPPVGTSLHRCFATVALCFPHPVSTIRVASMSNIAPGKTSALLSKLGQRSLVSVVDRTRRGGNWWMLTPLAEEGVDAKGRESRRSIALTP